MGSVCLFFTIFKPIVKPDPHKKGFSSLYAPTQETEVTDSGLQGQSTTQLMKLYSVLTTSS